ncbi:MAG: NAD-dependent epimerase/dehydratase family protein [Haloechinothrix sp.]
MSPHHTNAHQPLRSRHVLIAGGAGFLGSHICDRLLDVGADVTVVDNLATGRAGNVEHLVGTPGFRMIRADIATAALAVPWPVDYVMNLASPASPVDYLRLPIETLEAGSLGTCWALRLAVRKQARLLLTSTSEVYGDPKVHPQPESYWGNVNPIGPRSVYDEAKRFAEAITIAYHRVHGVSVGIARVFNVYGPRMRCDDGRVVPAFMDSALRDEPLPVHGTGRQTRSLCYVDDMVEGLLRLLVADCTGPVNLGNPHEVTMLELADEVQAIVGRHPGIRHLPPMTDDPRCRCPDTALARRLLGWRAETPLRQGLARTAQWFRETVAGTQAFTAAG